MLQFAQTLRRLLAKTFPKLIAFVEQARIVWVRLDRAVVSGASLGRQAANVEVADAQIAPDDGELRIKFCAAFPKLNRLGMTAAVVEQIAQILRRAGVRWIRGHGGFENGDLL